MSISIHVEGVEEVFAGLDKRIIALGLARGLTKLGEQARTSMKTRMRKVYTIKAGAIDKAIKVRPAKPHRLITIVTARSRRVSMKKYQAIEGPRGVRIKIMRRKKPSLLPGTFMATVQAGAGDSSTTGVFYRRSKRDSAAPVFRTITGSELPIEHFRGPSVTQLFASLKAFEEVSKFITRKLGKILLHEVEFAINQKASRHYKPKSFQRVG